MSQAVDLGGNMEETLVSCCSGFWRVYVLQLLCPNSAGSEWSPNQVGIFVLDGVGDVNEEVHNAPD